MIDDIRPDGRCTIRDCKRKATVTIIYRRGRTKHEFQNGMYTTIRTMCCARCAQALLLSRPLGPWSYKLEQAKVA